MVGGLKIADQTRGTQIRFRNIDDFESYINAIDQDYESEDPIFSGYFFITPKLLNLTKLIEANMEVIMILNMNLLNTEVLNVLYQQKDIVLSNVIIP